MLKESLKRELKRFLSFIFHLKLDLSIKEKREI